MRFRIVTVALAAVCLASCGTTGGTLRGLLPDAPAPLAKTTIDETALDAAWRGFDLALDAINLLPDSVTEPGQPRGKAIAGGIRTVLAALTAAENFAAAGNSKDYLQALAEAKAGIANIRLA